jgi:hypothetical protein
LPFPKEPLPSTFFSRKFLIVIDCVLPRIPFADPVDSTLGNLLGGSFIVVKA